MLRYLAIVALSALTGSILATLALLFWYGGTGSVDPIRFVFGFAIFTTIFTFPGAIMLAGLRALLDERGLEKRSNIFVTTIVALISGTTVAAVISWQMAGFGTAYALATAAALICFQSVMHRSPRYSARTTKMGS